MNSWRKLRSVGIDETSISTGASLKDA